MTDFASFEVSTIAPLAEEELDAINGGVLGWGAAVATATAVVIVVKAVWDTSVEAGEKLHDAVHPDHA